MSKEFTKLERELVELYRRNQFDLMAFNSSVRVFIHEVRRSQENGAALPPHAMAVRVSLATDVVEREGGMPPFLAELSQKLAALLEEQVKELQTPVLADTSKQDR